MTLESIQTPITEVTGTVKFGKCPIFLQNLLILQAVSYEQLLRQ
jgi:hypothetical protein